MCVCVWKMTSRIGKQARQAVESEQDEFGCTVIIASRFPKNHSEICEPRSEKHKETGLLRLSL